MNIVSNDGRIAYNVFSCLGLVRACATDPLHNWGVVFPDCLRNPDGTLFCLPPLLQAWVGDLGACTGMPDQLMYFSPWLRCRAVWPARQTPRADKAPTFLVGKTVALNLGQVEALHVSLPASPEHDVHVVADTHGGDRLVLTAAPGERPADVVARLQACAGVRFVGPFVHDCVELTQKVGLPDQGWSLLVMQSAIAVDMLLEVDKVQHGVPAPPGFPASMGTPTVWRLDMWLNNGRHLSNVIVASCAASRAGLQAELLTP